MKGTGSDDPSNITTLPIQPLAPTPLEVAARQEGACTGFQADDSSLLLAVKRQLL
jgi:hypothetical protein